MEKSPNPCSRDSHYLPFTRSSNTVGVFGRPFQVSYLFHRRDPALQTVCGLGCYRGIIGEGKICQDQKFRGSVDQSVIMVGR